MFSLEQDLFMARPTRNESSLDFGKRLQVLRSNVAQKIANQANINATTKEIYLRQYDQLALKTFIRGLPTHLQFFVRIKDTKSLEAITIIIEEQNFQFSQNMFRIQ